MLAQPSNPPAVSSSADQVFRFYNIKTKALLKRCRITSVTSKTKAKFCCRRRAIVRWDSLAERGVAVS